MRRRSSSVGISSPGVATSLRVIRVELDVPAAGRDQLMRASPLAKDLV